MWFNKKNPKEPVSLRNIVSIRMEAIGGQGANSAGKILAESAVLGMNYNGNHFSTFGSEKRGSPVKSFVRFSTQGQPVRSASFIKNPDLLVIFHESLLESHLEVLLGVADNTDLIVNTPKNPEDLNFPKDIRLKKIGTIDATSIALKFKCGINSVLLGALSKFCPEIDHLMLSLTFKNYFNFLSDQILTQNLQGFEFGFSNMKAKQFSMKQTIKETHNSPLPEMGWLNAPIGGLIINPGNTILKDHSASRKGVAPKFTKELCFNCGFCDMVCPDFCFVWDIDPSGNTNPILKGIDYQYCKGCQKCITVCPVEALTPELEINIEANDKTQKVFPEVTSEIIEKRWKNKDWTKYVENLSQEEIMISLQTEILDSKSYLRPDFSDEIRLKIEEQQILRKAKKEILK